MSTTIKLCILIRNKKHKKMTKIYLAILILVTYINITVSQDTGYYYKYDLERFITSKVGDVSIDSIKTHIKYPPILRENEIEGYSKFMIKSNGNKHGSINTTAFYRLFLTLYFICKILIMLRHNSVFPDSSKVKTSALKIPNYLFYNA